MRGVQIRWFTRPKDYVYTTHWFDEVKVASRQELLANYVGQPNLKYLEVGSFEGRSLIWMLENILTHSTSQATCIDIAPHEVRARFLNNISHSRRKKSVKLISEMSETALSKFEPESFDLIYVDASHNMKAVMQDALAAWRILKPGGFLIFDDYWFEPQRFPTELHAAKAVDAFIAAHRRELDWCHRTTEMYVQKKMTKFKGIAHMSSYWQNFHYNWYSGALFYNLNPRALALQDQPYLECLLRMAHKIDDYSVATRYLEPVKLTTHRGEEVRATHSNTHALWLGDHFSHQVFEQKKMSSENKIHLVVQTTEAEEDVHQIFLEAKNLWGLYITNSSPEQYLRECVKTFGRIVIDVSSPQHRQNFGELLSQAWPHLEWDGAVVLSGLDLSTCDERDIRFMNAFLIEAPIQVGHDLILLKNKL